MKNVLSKLGAAAMLIGFVAQIALPASAEPMGPNARFARQQTRINHGVANGSLTQHEYNRDQRHLKSIEHQTRVERNANGGKLTANERAHVEGRLNNNSRRVYFTKHNLAKQPGAR